MEQWNQKINRPIEFYGQVLDENGNPIEGASISFLFNRFTSPEGSFTTNTTSDTNGLFSLKGIMGSTLSVNVEKAGYYPIKSKNQIHFNYTDQPATEIFYPDSQNPVVFHLRKKGAGTELITSKHGVRPDIVISDLRDGSTKRVDFFSQQVGNGGQLELSAVKPGSGEPKSQWSFRMSIPDGGFIEENDEFPFEAPENGYTPTISYDFTAGQTNWTERFQKSYYIKFGQPPEYGRIDIQTAIDTGTVLQYVVNPSGSRNLEPSEPPSPQSQLPPGWKIVPPKDQ